jgi:hypothetical protein
MRSVTIPCALYLERAEHIPNRSDPAMVVVTKLEKGWVDIGSARAIYPRLNDGAKVPAAVVIEHTNVQWRFIVTSDAEARKWAADLSRLAARR